MTLATHKPGETVTVVVQRDGARRPLTVVRLAKRPEAQALLGVQARLASNVTQSVLQAAQQVLQLDRHGVRGDRRLLQPATFQHRSGARASWARRSRSPRRLGAGPLDYACLVALLSLSLGVMNILPIPPLDGGKIAIELIEKHRGRPLPRKSRCGYRPPAPAALRAHRLSYVRRHRALRRQRLDRRAGEREHAP